MNGNSAFEAKIMEMKEQKKISLELLDYILHSATEEERETLYRIARETSQAVFGKNVYLRGLIEFTNYCRNDCFYCGIRAGNRNVSRYRLSPEEILQCCDKGAELGFRTFVLQGGEDPYYSDDRICEIVRAIKKKHPDHAITLSIGEKSYESYKRYFEAGAERYLLRHETANEEHYALLHPASLSGAHRKQCLRDLKKIGYQVGCGIMVGTPHQTTEHIYEDILFMQDLMPHMIGIGPFLAHKDTPFRDEPDGSAEETISLLAILRILFPKVLLPATTALGTADSLGREKGILAGANVIMPNLSPSNVRDKYLLYDGKICTGEEAAECNSCLRARMAKIGYTVVDVRGDHPDFSSAETAGNNVTKPTEEGIS